MISYSVKAKVRFFVVSILLIFMLVTGILFIEEKIQELLKYSDFTEDINETDAFRANDISLENQNTIKEYAEKNSLDYVSLLSAGFYMSELDLASKTLTPKDLSLYETALRELKTDKSDAFDALLASMKAIWSDVTYFPVPVSETNEKATVTFSNSWMFERNFGGTRGHEGTDIMAAINKRGYYPILSMTDGTIENIGWLTKGGYRIGIRSTNGGYFYYAHLYDYAEDFKVGDIVQAGEIIGFMGDSGYGSIEGTVGKFDVHLHVGIYIKTKNNAELSINPYWVLKSLEDKKLTYQY